MPTTSSNTYDAIVIGGGHNGLVNGAYLAKAGLRTLIVERRPIVGGAAITLDLSQQAYIRAIELDFSGHCCSATR